jgi:voltage-gated potassium channel
MPRRTARPLYIHGDAVDDDVLIEANVHSAKGVFAITGDDSRNLMIALTARQLAPQVRIVARCNDMRNVEKMRKAGADAIVSPNFTGGMRIASAMIRPHVVSFLDEMLRTEHKLRVEEVVVPASFHPMPLSELNLRGASYVLLAVRGKGDWTFNPPPDFIVEPGQVLVAMASPHGRFEMESALLPDGRGGVYLAGLDRPCPVVTKSRVRASRMSACRASTIGRVDRGVPRVQSMMKLAPEPPEESERGTKSS